MFCPKCGTNNIDSVNLCATCGAELVDNQPEQKTITMNTVSRRLLLLQNILSQCFLDQSQQSLAQKEFDSLNLICTTESEQQVSIKESYDNLVSELKNEDGTGHKSITVTKFTDESSQKELKASRTYSCELRIEYDYVTISKDW